MNATGGGGVFGIDVSDVPGPLSIWQCLGDQFRFAIVRCYRDVGSSDQNCAETVKNAWAAGFAHVDVYHFPDRTKSGAEQIQESLAYINQNKVKFGQYWLDIEGSWGSDTAANVHLISDMRSALEAAGISVGIYTGLCWRDITGDDTSFADLPLWYAHYDANPSFSDYCAKLGVGADEGCLGTWGGWPSPAMKQFEGDASKCGADVDLDWYPL